LKDLQAGFFPDFGDFLPCRQADNDVLNEARNLPTALVIRDISALPPF
jgi:hypothetical protein